MWLKVVMLLEIGVPYDEIMHMNESTIHMILGASAAINELRNKEAANA